MVSETSILLPRPLLVCQVVTPCKHKLKLPQAEEAASDKWSLLSWVEGSAVHRVVAAAVRQPLVDEGLGEDPDAALRLLRGLKDRAALAKLLRTEAMVEGIIDLVWAETEALQRAGAATSSEIQSKFSGAIELSYGGLDKFFGGLEAIVGGPNPKLLEGMEGEHINGPGTESTDTFTPGNYGITTSSLVEWKFIVDAEADPTQLGLARWPEESEEKLPNRTLCRKHRPLAGIKKEAESRNEQLVKGNNSRLGEEELIAAISYTGPVMPSSQCCPHCTLFSNWTILTYSRKWLSHVATSATALPLHAPPPLSDRVPTPHYFSPHNSITILKPTHPTTTYYLQRHNPPDA